MSLQARLDAFKADFLAGRRGFTPSAEVVGMMGRAVEELRGSGVLDHAKKIGDLAPEFTLAAADGVVFSSKELLKKGPLIVSFYRGVWCPYCNLELQALQASLAYYRAAGADLVAISPQTPVNSRRSERENELDFPILSDVGGAVAEAFGIRFALPDYLIELYKTFGINLPEINGAEANGDESWTLPVPARFLIASSGEIHYADINPDYTHRPEPEALLPALHALNATTK